jgi:hypothetical protein
MEQSGKAASMTRTPIHPREEYIEQAYFFQTCRQRQLDGHAMQEILAQLDQEILATSKLPFAIQFMLAELRHSGRISDAFERLPHYFTPFQAYVLSQAEGDTARLTFDQALFILEREAQYRANNPNPPGLFIFELEAMSRNRLGYAEGLRRLTLDSTFDERWCNYIELVRAQLGVRELPELVFARSEAFIEHRRRLDASYIPSFKPLFSSKEGRIAEANIGRDPVFFFAALQRQLGYPEVPRPAKQDTLLARLDKIARAMQRLDERFRLLEQEVRGSVDLSPFMVNPDKNTPIDQRIPKPVDDEPNF